LHVKNLQFVNIGEERGNNCFGIRTNIKLFNIYNILFLTIHFKFDKKSSIFFLDSYLHVQSKVNFEFKFNYLLKIHLFILDI